MNSIGGGSPLWTENSRDLGLDGDPALVVKELGRARRNRIALATAVAVIGFVVIVLPDLEAGSLGAGSAIFSVVLIIAYYRILWSRRRERENVESFPAVAGALQEMERGARNRPSVFGYVICRGWLIKKSMLTFDFLRTSDICWVYGKNTKNHVNFIPTSTTHSVEAMLQSGRTLSDTDREKVRDEKLVLLHTAAPWAFFGYSKELEKAWRKNRAEFVAAVKNRIVVR